MKIVKELELIAWIITIVTIILVFITNGGCAMIERVSDVFFGPGTEQVIPTVPKAQMWETIKGLTPNWLAIPIIALGAVAMFNGAAKLGMSCIIFGSVNLFMALATSRFGFWMALFGLIGSMAAVAASIVAKNVALKEIIGNVQSLKKAGWMPIDAKRILSKQVKSTKKIVQQIKMKARLKGNL